MRGKWGRATMARDELLATNKALVDQITVIKMKKADLSKAVEKLKGKQPISNKTSSQLKAKRSATQKFLDGSDSPMESPSEEAFTSGDKEARGRARDKKRKVINGKLGITWSPTRGLPL